ncbi:glycerophosphodiester phosphodiesterase [Paenibacillus naphthalenovorans]|uniref:glycerophosphodiester phosphodiesterase n=1 Tax=Paenibacillus naphthalenovorans TaxID=162209 RepID=UPI003D2978EF
MLVISHRGASGYAPENTMNAFQLAVDMKADGIELDLHLTKDGEVVICHDDDVERTTNGHGLIKELTLAQLRSLDAGSWYDESFSGASIPTLREFMTFAAGTGMLINLEIKNIPYYHKGIEEKVVRSVLEHDMLDRVIISSFDHYALAETARLAPSIKLGVLFSTRLIDPWDYARRLPFDVHSLHPHFSFVDEAYIRQSHEHGYKVYPYTVNDPEWAKPLALKGLDGVITNYPDCFL